MGTVKSTKAKLLVALIVFMIIFSNCGFTLSAIATSDEFQVITNGFFRKDEISFKAYFEDENGDEVKQITANVNQKAKLILEILPQVQGYLRTADLKAVSADGSDVNFKITNISYYEDHNSSLEVKQETNAEINDNELNNQEGGETTEPETTENPSVATNTIVEDKATNTTVEDEVTNTAENVATTNTESVEAEDNTVVDELSGKSTISTNTVSGTSNTIDPNVVNEVSNSLENANTVSEDNNNVSNEEEPSEERGPVEVITQTVEEPATSAEVENNEDVLIDEDKVIEEKTEEASEELLDLPFGMKIISDNEIEVMNIIKGTKLVLDIEYEMGDILNVENLMKDIRLQISGTYINSDLEDVPVAKEDMVTLGWEYTKDVELTSEYTKFSPFEVGDINGTIVENRITVKRDVSDEKFLPIKNTKLEVGVPQVNGKLPIEISIIGEKLLATRGEDTGYTSFSKENWSYDPATGKIQISVENTNLVYASGLDEYVIIYRYEDKIDAENSDLGKDVKLTIEEYSAKENHIIEKEVKETQNIKVDVGELVTYSISSTEEKIGKAKIYANYNNETPIYETEYTNQVNVNILTSDILEELKINCNQEVYKDANGFEFAAEGIEYRRVKFSFFEISTLLANGGDIVITNEAGEVLYTFNKDIIKSEEDCIVNLNGETGIIIYARNIAKNGSLNFEVAKVIKGCNFDRAAFKNFTSIESRITAEVKYQKIEEPLTLPAIGTAKYFEEASTYARLSLNKETLSTTKSNDNVEIKIELNNDKENSNLYVNPAFEIVFPKYVNDVTIQNLNVLYENGLKVSAVDTFKENDITKIKIEFEGTQQTFSESSITNGTNIIINANIKVDEYTPKKEDQIKLYYCNEGVSTYESQTKWTINKQIPNGILKTTNGFDVAIIKYQAPSGLIAINGIVNYDGNLSEVKSVKQGEVKEQIETNGSSKIMTMELLALNNTDNKCSDVVLVGRIPFAGVKDVVTNRDLGTTVNTVMKDLIREDTLNTNTVDIYYSNNPEATKDLDNIGNGWSREVGNINEVRSFLIFVKGAMQPGQVLRYTYDFEIPGNLPYETNIEGSFGAFYNNNSDIAVVYESSVADPVGLRTETGPKVEATLSVDVGDGAEIGEYQYMTYTIRVENTGSIVAEGVKVTAIAPSHTSVYEYNNNTDKIGNYKFVNNNTIEFKKDILNPGEFFEETYMVRTGELDTLAYQYEVMGNEILTDEEGTYYITQELDGSEKKNYFNPDEKIEQTITHTASVSFENFETTVDSNTITNKIVKSNYQLEASTLNGFDTHIVGNTFTVLGFVKNISKNDIENGTIQLILPNELKYNSLKIPGFEEKEYSINYDEKKNIVNVEIKKIEKDVAIQFYFEVFTRGFSNRAEIQLIGTTKDAKTEKTNLFVKIRGQKFQISQTTNVIGNQVLEQEEVKFLITINNLGNVVGEDILIENNIPENLEDVKVSSPNSVDKLNITSDKIEIFVRNLGENELKTFIITGKATKLNGESSKIITSRAKLSHQYSEDIYSNEIKVAIIKNNALMDNNNSGNTTNNNSQNTANNANSNNYNSQNSYNSNKNNSSNTNNSSSSNVNNSNNGNGNNNSNNSSSSSSNNSSNKNTSNSTLPKYTVSGQVWLDENGNGVRDEDEEKLSAVKVQLMKGNSNIKITTTDNLGEYKFTDVEQGEYAIVFTYDEEKYKATTYNQTNTDGTINSSAQENTKGIAVTNIINVTGDISNINLGLVDKDNFDLTVNKYITKAVITTSNKITEEIEYEDLDLAKLEIAAKKLNKSKVDITYKIVVENVGNIAGKAVAVIDYLPEEMHFEESLNSGWYLGKDGNVYNETLKEIELKPGEKKELFVTLTQNMTEENTGVASNRVEVKGENQDGTNEKTANNISTQETLILIKTGNQIAYVTLTAAVLLAVAIVYMNINKNTVYSNKDNKKQIKIKKVYK